MSSQSHSGAEQATTVPRKRGSRGQGRRQRRAIQRVAEQRQAVWSNASHGYAVNTTVPSRIRVRDLTNELDELFETKRSSRSAAADAEGRTCATQPRINVTARIPVEDHDRLSRIAEANASTVSRLVARAVAIQLDNLPAIVIPSRDEH